MLRTKSRLDINFIVLKAMKGLKYCVWYDGGIKKLFMLDPDLITRIQVADFDHFTDLAFTPEAYVDVSKNIRSSN